MKREKNCGDAHPFPTARGAATTFILVTILTLLLGCEDYPKDVKHTLDSIQGGVLHVGLVENAPWVMRGPSGPTGLEPEIIQELATQLNAEVRWHWGSTAVVIQALEQHQLHLAVGGFTAGPRLPKTVAPTKAYYTTRYTIGLLPSEGEAPTRLEGLSVALPFLSPLHQILKNKKADLQPMTTPEASDLPVAGPMWWLKAHGYQPGHWELLTEKQVMVVTKGENAWMKALESHLNSLKALDEKLQDLEASQ